MKIYFSGCNEDLQGPWSSNHPVLLQVPVYVCIYYFWQMSKASTIYFIHASPNSHLNFLVKDKHCLSKHSVSWPKNNHVRQQQQEADGNREEPGSQSSFKAVVELAKEFGSMPVAFFESSISVQPHACMGQGNLLCMGHTQSKNHSG